MLHGSAGVIWLAATLTSIIGIAAIVAAYKRRVVNVATVNEGVDEFYDFIGGTAPFQELVSGGGSIVSTVSPTQHPGYYPGAVATSITSAADSAGLLSYGTTELRLDQGSSDLQARLSAQLDPFPINTALYKRKGGFGFFERNANTDIRDGTALGAYFYFDGDTSGNWICKVVSAAATNTFITTQPVEYADLYLRIIVNPAQTFFYVNNVLVYTGTQGGTALAGVYCQFGFREWKTDNGAEVGSCYDAIKLLQKLATPRQFAAVT